MSLFELRFGRSDAESAGDIGPEVSRRMGVSVQLALPLFVLQVFASTAFALLLVMFRHTRLDFWGVVACVLMLSISSLFYIIVGQFLFSRLLRIAPISGYVPGWDVAKFLVLPIVLSLLSRLGTEARLYRAMFLEEIGKDYVRTARAKGLSETVVLFRHVLRNALLPIVTSAGSYLPYVFLGSLVFESFFGLPGLGAYVIDAITKQDFAVVRTMVFVGSLLYIATFVLIDVAYTWVDPRVRSGLRINDVSEIRLAVDGRDGLGAGRVHGRVRRDGGALAQPEGQLAQGVPRCAGAVLVADPRDVRVRSRWPTACTTGPR